MFYVCGITLNNNNYKRKNSHTITVRSYFRTHLNLLRLGVCRSVHPCLVEATATWKTSKLLYAWLTCIFHRRVCKPKFFWRNLTVGQHFRPVVNMGTEKNLAYSKVTSLVLISHFREMIIVIFRKIYCNEE